MRTKIMLALSVLVLSALNYGIYEKEQIKRHGETVLLELAPVDPRSLIQGDYMRLRYAVERNVPVHELASSEKRGYMVIRANKKSVAEFARIHKGEALAANEKLLHFHRQYNQIRIVPDSFLFQEGHAAHYEKAKYGIFKFDDSAKPLLVGLADGNREAIVVRDAAIE